MRERELRLIITFHTATDAIAFEKYFNEHALPGRLIPVPRDISASCGLSWRARPEERGQIEEAVLSGDLRVGSYYLLFC